MEEEKTKSAVQAGAPGYFISDMMPEVDDQFQKLKDSIVLKREKDPGLVAIMVTGESHEDGATIVTVNLARALALDGKSKILVVDGDLRRPILHKIFSLEEGDGFSEVLMDKAPPDSAIRKTSIPKISVLPCQTRSHPSQLSMEKLDEILVQFKKNYDYIIFNSSPINKYSDSIVLGAHLDAAVIVMRAEHTKWDGLERAKNQLEQKGINILGVVMNRRKYFIPRFLYKRFIV
jgi:protein-tyrosine kinase